MNTYKTKFKALCPVNGRVIDYSLQIDTAETIPVEDILSATSAIKPEFHEVIADELKMRFPGRQTLVAFHHGVEITTVRP